jgi:hypothetical protein
MATEWPVVYCLVQTLVCRLHAHNAAKNIRNVSPLVLGQFQVEGHFWTDKLDQGKKCMSATLILGTSSIIRFVFMYQYFYVP